MHTPPPLPKPPSGGEAAEGKRADIVMASPLREMQPRQWDVHPSPEKPPAPKGASPGLEALAKKHKGMFNEIAL